MPEEIGSTPAGWSRWSSLRSGGAPRGGGGRCRAARGARAGRPSPPPRHGDPEGAAALIENALGDLSAEVNGLRRLMSDLRPPVLDQSGLENALRDHLATLF